METIRKIGSFFAAFAIIVGAGCAIGMNFTQNNAFAGICCCVLTAAAAPTFVKLVKGLLNN